MARREGTSNEIDMLHGPLLGKIVLFALPLALSGVLQQLFNSVDAVVAGQLIGAVALAAVGSNSVVITLFLNLFVGLAVGANAVIARYIGEGSRGRIQDAVHTIVVLSLISGVILIVVGLAASKPLLVLIDTPANVLNQAVLYLRIFFLGMVFIMFYNFGSAVLRSKGDTKRPLYALILSGLVNVVLNLAFVLIVPWGVAGLAIATVISNGVAAAMVCYWLMNEDETFRFYPRQLRVNGNCMKAVLAIGLPAGIQGVVFSLSNVCIQGGINSFGAAAVAGNSAAMNAEFISYFFITAFVQAAVTFVAQNHAAGNVERCKRSAAICMACAVAVGAFTNMLFILGGNILLGIFTADAAAITFGWVRLLHVEICQFMVCSYEVTAGAMRGLGSSMLPASITIVGTCLLRFAWVFWVFPIYGTFGWLLWVYPVSWVVTGVSMVVAYFIVSRRAFAKIAA